LRSSTLRIPPSALRRQKASHPIKNDIYPFPSS
jgi:hypothetical protein